MMTRKSLSLLLGLAFLLFLESNAQPDSWVHLGGPEGGNVSCFASTSAGLFAGTADGAIFVSTDNGTTWSGCSSHFPGHWPSSGCVNVIAANGDNLFVGTNRSIFLSTDNGATWNAVDNGLPDYGDFRALWVDGARVFAGAWDHGVFLSTDNGGSWSSINSGLTNNNVIALAVASDGGSGTNIFAGTSEGVFLSTNTGSSWTNASTGLPNTYVHALAVIPNGVGGGDLFAGTGDGVFISTNNGSTWTAANTGLEGALVNAFVSAGDRLFAASYGAVFSSTDQGAHWTTASSGLPNVNVATLTVLASGGSGNHLLAGTSGPGVYRSTDNGTTWSAANRGFTGLEVGALLLEDDGLYAGTAAGIYHSGDRGMTWNFMDMGTYFPVRINALAANISAIFAGLDGWGVYMSTDKGSTWSSVNSGLGIYQVYALATNNSKVYAGGFTGGVFLTTDNGASWTTVNDGLTNNDISALVLDGPDLIAGGGSNVFLLADGSSVWADISNGIGCCVNALAVSADGVFGGTLGNGLFLTKDNGSSWINCDVSMRGITSVVTSGSYAVVAGDVQSGDQGGIFFSGDGGTTWTPLISGLTTPRIRALAFDAEGYVYAATANSGLFRTNESFFPAPTQVSIDVEPGSCPNTLSTKAKGMLPVAILGTRSFDVRRVDISSIRLQGVTPLRWSREDVARPFRGIVSDCRDCNEKGPDGHKDLVLKFDNQAIVAAMGTVSKGECISLTLRAMLRNGTVIEGKDYVRIKSQLHKETVEDEKVPTTFALHQNFPNPFNPTTTIRFTVPKSSHVSLAVFDALGQQVAQLVNSEIEAGYHEVQFNVSNLASGVYFYRMQASDFVQTRKFCVIR